MRVAYGQDSSSGSLVRLPGLLQKRDHQQQHNGGEATFPHDHDSGVSKASSQSPQHAVTDSPFQPTTLL